MTTPFWTPARDDQMRDLFLRGMSDLYIADAIGCTTIGVTRRRQRVGLIRPPSGGVKQPKAPRERLERLSTVITRIDAPVPLGLVLGDVVVVAGVEATFIAYNPDGELVCVSANRDVIVVGAS